MPAQPYKTTPLFDAASLPEAIRSAHSTKGGVWGLLRVMVGEARLVFHDPPSEVLVTPDRPGEIAPEAVHHVEIVGPVQLQIEFYRERPGGN